MANISIVQNNSATITGLNNIALTQGDVLRITLNDATLVELVIPVNLAGTVLLQASGKLDPIQ